MDAVGDGPAQIVAERRREPQLLGAARLSVWRAAAARIGPAAARPAAEQSSRRTERRGDLLRREAEARGSSVLNVPPLVALRRLAAAAARALRIAERQPHLEGEIGAQEIWKVGAVGANDEPHLVFAADPDG